MSTKLDNFRMKLEELRKRGVDIDPDNVVEQIIKAPEELAKLDKEEREELMFALAKEKVDKLLEDFFSFYRPKGRRLRVAIEIVKDDCADKYGERFVFSDNMSVISVIGIGTKGKYEKIGG